MELQEGGAIMQSTPWVVVEADHKQTIQSEFGQGEIVDKFSSKDHAVFSRPEPEVAAASEHRAPRSDLQCRHLP
jgi:hypothetical protein